MNETLPHPQEGSPRRARGRGRCRRRHRYLILNLHALSLHALPCALAFSPTPSLVLLRPLGGKSPLAFVWLH